MSVSQGDNVGGRYTQLLTVSFCEVSLAVARRAVGSAGVDECLL